MGTSFINHIAKIFLMSPEKKMFWIAALWIVASWAIVKDVLPVWNVSLENQPTNSMGVFSAVMPYLRDFSVASFSIIRSVPTPASFLHHDLGQESIDNRRRESAGDKAWKCGASVDFHHLNKKPTLHPNVILASDWPHSESRLEDELSLNRNAVSTRPQTIAA